MLLPGCGSDSTTSSGGDGEISVASGSLSKAKFVKQADAICQKRRAEFSRAFEKLAKEFQVEEAPEKKLLGAVVDGLLVPTYDQLIEELSNLGAPSGDEQALTVFLRSIQKALDTAERNPSKAFAGLTPFTRSIKLANDYGIEGCAESLG